MSLFSRGAIAALSCVAAWIRSTVACRDPPFTCTLASAADTEREDSWVLSPRATGSGLEMCHAPGLLWACSARDRRRFPSTLRLQYTR